MVLDEGALYGCEVILLVCLPEEVSLLFHRYTKGSIKSSGWDVEREFRYYAGRTYTFSAGEQAPIGSTMVWVNANILKNRAQFVCTLAHELLHAVINIMDRVKVPINVETSEATCYYHDLLMRTALKHW